MGKVNGLKKFKVDIIVDESIRDHGSGLLFRRRPGGPSLY